MAIEFGLPRPPPVYPADGEIATPDGENLLTVLEFMVTTQTFDDASMAMAFGPVHTDAAKSGEVDRECEKSFGARNAGENGGVPIDRAYNAAVFAPKFVPYVDRCRCCIGGHSACRSARPRVRDAASSKMLTPDPCY